MKSLFIRMKSSFIFQMCAYLCGGLIALWIGETFRVNLILDLFWSKIGQTKIQKIQEKENYENVGLLAGLPAGKDVTELTDIDQFYELQVYGYDTSNWEGWWDTEAEKVIVHSEYITFETDSIIPLGFYRLNSRRLDGHVGGSGRHPRVTHVAEYTNDGFMGAIYIYNQYYLVRLPDGNYVPALLDDSYYIKYRLTGKVQLPLGVAVDFYKGFSELQPYLEEYGVSSERILDMYCEKRYEAWHMFYTLFPFLLWPVIVFIEIDCGILIEALILKKPVIQHFKEYRKRKPDGT